MATRKAATRNAATRVRRERGPDAVEDTRTDPPAKSSARPATRPSARRPKAISAEETVLVTKSYGKDDDGTQDKETIEVKKFATEPAYVRVNAGVTKNMGNYESLRIDVALTVPCYTEEIDEVFPKVADRVADMLSEEQENYLGEE